MRKGVNGQAKIISTVLIMLIVIVAVVVIYNVVNVVVSEKGEGIGFGLKNYLQQLQLPNCGDGYCNLSEESCENCITDCGECDSGDGGSVVEIPLTVTRDISSLGNGQYQIDLVVDVDETKNLNAYIIEETLPLDYGILSSNYEGARKINSPSWLAVADDSLTGLGVEDTTISYIVGLLVPALVVNGDFYGSAVGWDGVLTNWHYGTLEIAFYSDSGSNLENISQDIGVIAGRSYQVNYSLFVTECSGNNELRVTLGDQIVHTHDCADLIGSHTYITTATNNGDLVFEADNSFGGGSDVLDFALDDISVREVNSNPSPLEISGIVITNNSQGNVSGETEFIFFPDSCIDTEEGTNHFVAGNVSGYAGGINYFLNDRCINEYTLKEYYCWEDGYRSSEVNCFSKYPGENYNCSEGICG